MSGSELTVKSKEFFPALFSRHAPAYRERTERLMRSGLAGGRWAVIDAVKPRPGMRILDLACGPGTLALHMARELGGQGEVVGIDLAAGMLDLARQHARALPVRFLQMDVDTLQFPPGTFDAATCGHGLHFLPNLGRSLGGVRRVLKNRARFAASVPAETNPGEARVALAGTLDARLGEAPRVLDHEETRLICSSPERLQAVALAAGFRLASVEPVSEQRLWPTAEEFVTDSLSWWSNAHRLEGLSEHVRELLATEAVAAVRAAVGPGQFETTSSGWVLSADA